MDTYGKTNIFIGDSSFIPFRYQGQYEDTETGLYYNRFRYYDCNDGRYISQDPIGLASGEFGFYNYVEDSNAWVDVFGLNSYKADNGDIVWQIKDNFPAGSYQSRQLRRFVKAWNEEIEKAGGSMTRRKPTALEEKASSKWKREMREKYPKRFKGKVVGHTPDAAAGGPSENARAMALDSSVNGSIGGQVAAKPVGFTYNRVEVYRP